MSEFTNIRTRPSDRDYNRKPYVNKEGEGYHEMMRRPADKAMFNQRLEAQSEFKKPYLADNYPEMEHFYPPPFTNIQWPWVFPEFPGPVPMHGEWYEDQMGAAPCLITCHSPLYCDEAVVCHPNVMAYPQGEDAAGVGWKVWVDGAAVGVRHKKGPQPPKGVPLSEWLASRTFQDKTAFVFDVLIDPPAGSWPVWPDSPMANLEARLTDSMGGQCATKIKVFCRPASCCYLPGYAAPTIDEGSTDDTIDNGTPAAVTIQNGCPPYNWQVSGTGYSIDPSGESESLSATVSVVSGTCGVNFVPYCTVTVTDECGNSATKVIRHTDGAWQLVETGNPTSTNPYCSFNIMGAGTDQTVDGKDRWTVYTEACGLTVGDPGPPPDYPDCPEDDCLSSSWGWNCSGTCAHVPPCGAPPACGAGSCTGVEGYCGTQGHAMAWLYQYEEWGCP